MTVPNAGKTSFDPRLAQIEQQIELWHGIAAPNDPARRQAEQLVETIEGYARLRSAPALDAAPADFAHTLRSLADPGERSGQIEKARAERDDVVARTGLAAQTSRLQSRKVTSIELLEAGLERIDRLDPTLNAVLWVRRDEARRRAAICDSAEDPAIAGRLHGVPLAHKDLFGECGRPETGGSDFWRDHAAEVTATVMQRLTRAGSFSFAGLNMAEFAQNPTGHNAHFGDCINPWSAGVITGGSSSGSAVAVAAGYCAGSLGTDTGGSIRLPAACCGVTGLKPTYGLVSRAGVVPLCASLDCVGPIARTALDCAILLDVIAGPDGADPTTADRPPPCTEAALDGDVRGQRIGIAVNGFFEEAAPEVVAACRSALGTLRDAGATLVEVEIPLLEQIALYGGTMARVEAAALHAGWMRGAARRYVAHVSARLYPGYAIPATYYVEAMQQRPVVLAEFGRAVFDRVDVLATPTLRSRAPSRAETDVDRGEAGTERRFFAVGGNVRPFNYLGLPAVSVPCGFDAAGVPIGLQLVGRPFGEARLLRIADAYQRIAGPPPQPPL